MRAEQLIEAMERRLRGEAVGIGPFARLASPPAFDAEGLGKLGRFARREADGLLSLLDDPDPGARHAAAYLLGRSADARAVDPLFGAVARSQRDRGCQCHEAGCQVPALGHSCHGDPLKLTRYAVELSGISSGPPHRSGALYRMCYEDHMVSL